MFLTGSVRFSADRRACSPRAVGVSCILLRNGHYVICLMGAIRVFTSAVTSVRVSTAVREI